jgi:hypothetical protein
MASDRESKIPPTGDLIRGVPAPGGTWPDHDTSSGGSRGRRWRGGEDILSAYADDLAARIDRDTTAAGGARGQSRAGHPQATQQGAGFSRY